MNVCADDIFEIIKELKDHIISATNIESSPEEMQVLDNICFRLWQLGLTLETKQKAQKYDELTNELGCPLENIIPLLLAYKQGYVYTKDVEEKTIKEEIISQVGLTTDDEWCLVIKSGFILDKYYKTTWWLKADRSE